MKNKNLLYLGIVLALVIGLPVAWYLLSPLWINVTVDESFPTVAAPTANVQATAAMSTAMAEPTIMMEEPMPAAEMTLLLQGSFYNIIHSGSGQASVYQLADGSRILRLQGFEVDNGPDLYVYLVPNDPVDATVALPISGFFSLGRLKGNIGDQNYDIPAELDLSQFKSVVIWCQAFAVPFLAAPLQTP